MSSALQVMNMDQTAAEWAARMQISPERSEPFASGGVNVSVSAVRLFRMNGAFRVCVVNSAH